MLVAVILGLLAVHGGYALGNTAASASVVQAQLQNATRRRPQTTRRRA